MTKLEKAKREIKLTRPNIRFITNKFQRLAIAKHLRQQRAIIKAESNKFSAQAIAEGINEWVGLEFEMTRPMVESLAWAMAQDANLKASFDELVKAEAQRIADQHN